MFESQIIETQSSLLGNHFRVCKIDLFLMRETCTGKVNYHKVPVRKALKQQLLQVCVSMSFSSPMIDIHMVA